MTQNWASILESNSIFFKFYPSLSLSLSIYIYIYIYILQLDPTLSELIHATLMSLIRPCSTPRPYNDLQQMMQTFCSLIYTFF